MRRQEVEQLVADLAREICAGTGLLFVDTSYRKSNGLWRILVRVDRPEGVSINDCAEVSKTLGARLDELDPIEHEYSLEVSSAGLSDPLETDADFSRYIGRLIEIDLNQARGTGRGREAVAPLVGRLVAFGPELLTIAIDDSERTIARGTIRRVRPAVDFKGAGAKGE